MFTNGDFIPVIAPLGVGWRGQHLQHQCRIWSAGKVAEALGAEKLILLTNITGVLDENKNLLTGLTHSRGWSSDWNGVIYGGMIPKVGCALQMQ